MPSPITTVDATNSAMPAATTACTLRLEPFHSCKIHPHIVAKMMMLAI